MRRELTSKERQNLNEIEDAAFAIKATGDLMTNDLAIYKFYSQLDRNYAFADKASLQRLLRKSQSNVSDEEKQYFKSLYDRYKESDKVVYERLSNEQKADLVKVPVTKIQKNKS